MGFDIAEAAASGSVRRVSELVELGQDVSATGRDGTTGLCAASLWGHESVIKYLLSQGADINAENDGTGWTALHAAAFQEHGKVVRLLLEHGANVNARDHAGRTPVDYASISQSIWPFFAARDCIKSSKERLVSLHIIQRLRTEDDNNQGQTTTGYVEKVSAFSRPGSAYVRVQHNPLAPIDPLSRNTKAAPASSTRRPMMMSSLNQFYS